VEKTNEYQIIDLKWYFTSTLGSIRIYPVG
jgi:hypothetical protein